MANTVTTQILQQGERNALIKFTCLSDGTNETDVLKIDATKTGPLGVMLNGRLQYPGVKLRVDRIVYDVKGMGLRIRWVASPNVDMMVLGNVVDWDCKSIGGIPIPSDAVLPTGSIAFSTVGAVSGASYTVLMEITKNVQSV